ncbi:DNA cytosine methyltransferase [Streptomyces cinereoruber]|uniref:DNA cytosine methyltransferase n=1 Tax=Streptomyces cinereoruber TaxID=67260 RepID=UPI003C2D244A
MPDPRIGSLCTGYGGLDAAVQNVFGGTTAWTSDIDPGAARIITHRMPGVPNLGDLTATDWQAVLDEHGPVDIVTGGYPCQPFSTAGKRKGTADARHIWPHIANALRVLRPRYAIFENVAGHLRLGFDTVLRDLAAIGFDAEWCLVRASEVGAPHARQRLFLLAWPADAQGARLPGEGLRGRAAARGPAPADADRLGSDRRTARAEQAGREVPAGDAAADADRRGLSGHPERHSGQADGQPERAPRLDADGRRVQREAATDAPGLGRGEGRAEPARLEGRPDAPLGSAPDWGAYAPAIARWETVTGRRAPWATDDRRRLSPAFVEWLMGLDAGHVTEVPGLTRTQQLKALGNGVVPQQAEAAIRLLHQRAAAAR